MMDVLYLLQNLVTFILIGLIWTIQVVHYPAFLDISEDRFIEFEKKHTSRISILVVPLMLLELSAALAFLIVNPEDIKNIGMALIVSAIWLSTFFLSVPCHQKLSKGKDVSTIHRLVKTNWVRTVLWSIKGILLI